MEYLIGQDFALKVNRGAMFENGNNRDVWYQVPHYLWGDDVALQADTVRGHFQCKGDGKSYRRQL
jgi:hypothetical protein